VGLITGMHDDLLVVVEDKEGLDMMMAAAAAALMKVHSSLASSTAYPNPDPVDMNVFVVVVEAATIE